MYMCVVFDLLLAIINEVLCWAKCYLYRTIMFSIFLSNSANDAYLSETGVRKQIN